MARHTTPRHLSLMAALALVFATSACNRGASETRKETVNRDAKVADTSAAVEKKRNDEIASLNDRVAKIEREYTEKSAAVASGKRTPTASLHEEVKEDVTNVKQAVEKLSTTNADNWWEREEAAMRANIDDVAADVKRLAGTAPATHETPAETTATAPFTSRRDAFVADMKGRLDALDKTLDTVKAKGARETELKDTRARVKKIGDDLDKLARASADDWWDVSRARVSDYLDRVEASVKRLDDNKTKTE